jgi:hypothetical protein
MRKIIIAGLAMLTTLGAMLAVLLGSSASPVEATTAATANAVTTASKTTLLPQLTDVSCVSANFCAAVGSSLTSTRSARIPLALIWNGARWRETATPLPKGGSVGYLSSVSCTSSSYCVAVGNYFKNKSSDIPVAITWNGRAWTTRALPSLAGGQPYAEGISCAAARHCVVGFVANPMPKSGQVFIDVLTGATWAVHALTPPKGSEFASFNSVSCVSATHCVLAGVVYLRVGEASLLAAWNGKALSTMKATASLPAFMEGVSCASAKNCVAVGTWFTGPADLGYYGLWNGSIWKGARVLPQPKTMPLSSPVAVSCATPTSCLAVGYFRFSVPVKGNYADEPLAEVFNGRSWTRLSVPAVAGAADTIFSAVSCLSATSCVAVGNTDSGTPPTYSVTALTGFWNGKSWRLVKAS